MPSITTNQGILHFEAYGKGKPVILLPGWLGSWGLWQDTMAFLGQYYRAYVLDFWGGSQTGRKRNTYQVSDFASLVGEFFEQMGIARAPLVGHGLGGTLSLLTALEDPQRVDRLALLNAPIRGNALSLPLRLAAWRPVAALLLSAFPITRTAARWSARAACRDPRLAKIINDDLSPATLEAFLTSIASLRQTDLRHRLEQIRLPVLGIYADRDKIVSPRQWKALKRGVAHARIERYPKAGHFVMLDEPRACMQALKKFLDMRVS